LQIAIGLTAAQPTSFVVRENTLANIKDSGITTINSGSYANVPVIPQITNNNLLPVTAATGYTVRMCDNACTSEVDARGNWWGMIDPAAISAAIYDGVTKFGLGLVDASGALSGPVATAPAYVTGVDVSPDSTLGIQRRRRRSASTTRAETPARRSPTLTAAPALQPRADPSLTPRGGSGWSIVARCCALMAAHGRASPSRRTLAS
jgi:hypothetical protein